MQTLFYGNGNKLLMAVIAIGFILFTTIPLHAAQVTLAWDANDPIPDGYRVFRALEGVGYDYSAPVWAGTTTTCTISDLADYTTYRFVVRAFSGSNESASSNEVTFYHEPTAPTYTITGTADANGAILPLGPIIVPEGDSQTFTITPIEGYHVADVKVDGVSIGAVTTYTFSNVTEDHTISASFSLDTNSQDTYTITASAGQNGTISPSGQATIISGGSQTYAITPNDGYSIADVTVNGQSVGAVSTYTFTNVTSDNTINATFALQPHTVTASAGIGGSISPSGSIIVDHGSSMTFTITPNEGYLIGDVLVNGSSVGKVTTYSFIDITDDQSITAGFEPTKTTADTIIIDDGDPGTTAVGTWKVSSGTGYYGEQSVYSREAGAEYVYQTDLSGSYEVSLWWTPHDNRGTAVPVEIWDGDNLLDVVEVNQQQNCSQWNSMGTYSFTGQVKIVVVSMGDCSANADAIRLQSEIVDTLIIDDGDPGTTATGTWIISSGTGYYGEQSLYSKETGAKYAYQAELTGTYGVALWWTPHTNRGTGVPVEIWDGETLLDIVEVNQQQDCNQWNTLGTYNFTGQVRVVVISEGDCSANADAVRFKSDTIISDTEPDASVESLIMDDGDTGTTASGVWKVSTGPGYYGEQSVYSRETEAEYTYQAELSGTYQVSLWWTEHYNRGTAVPIEIWDGDTLLDVVEVNQKKNCAQWNLIGTYSFTDRAKIVVVSEGDCSANADAVSFQK